MQYQPDIYWMPNLPPNNVLREGIVADPAVPNRTVRVVISQQQPAVLVPLKNQTVTITLEEETEDYDGSGPSECEHGRFCPCNT